jgi:hypothetical protein
LLPELLKSEAVQFVALYIFKVAFILQNAHPILILKATFELEDCQNVL